MSQTKAQLIDPTDGSIVNADINASAAIAASKIADFVTGNTNDRVLTATGTANSLNGEANLTFDGQTLTVSAPTNDTPLIVDTGSSNGAHLRFQKDGANKHFIGCGGGISLGDVDDLSLRTVDNIIFGVGTSEKVRIDSSGRLGIGTSSPGDFHSLASNLVIHGSADSGMTISSGASSDGRIFFADGTSGSAESEGHIRYDHATNKMHLAVSDTDVVTLHGSNVGIGTQAPSTLLELSGGGNTVFWCYPNWFIFICIKDFNPWMISTNIV